MLNYEKMYKELIDMEEFAAATKIQHLLEDVEEELQTAEQYQLNKLSVNYDMTIVLEEQKSLHKQFKEMCKEV